MAHDLPDDWRERFVEMIRGASPLEDDWFTGGPVLSSMEQIAVYKNQYRLRLYGALVDEVPGLHHLLGEGAEPLLRAYLYDRPSTEWTLNRVADHLIDWLEQRMCPRQFVDMARLDRAVQVGFDAASGRSLQPEDLVAMPRLKLQPHVKLLRLSWNVHWVRSAVLARKDEVPALVEGEYPVVVFRRGIKMRHWQMPAGAFAILEGIDEGLPVEAAIDQAFSRGQLSMETLGEDIGTWFQDYSSRDLVELAEPDVVPL